MTNPFEFSDTNKRYLTQSYYLKKRFGCKVIKISLDCGFTCPNIDGTKGTGGCTYCLAGSGEFAGDSSLSVTEQFNSIKNQMSRKWGEGKYIPYFQANTNTYGPLSKIRAMIEEALSLDDVVGIAVSTRPDCISSETLDYLEQVSKRTYLTVELGLQTIFDKTAEKINRCHSYGDFLRCFERLKARDINVCVHLINGLPGETLDMMLQSVKEVSALGIHSIKLHLLHILRGTVMEQQYLNGEFDVMSMEEYVELICEQLKLLPPDVIVQRLTGDGGWNVLTAPLWSRKKMIVLNEIDKRLAAENAYQGINCGK